MSPSCCRWVERSGGILRLPRGQSGPEISTSLCYFGESINHIAGGRIFTSPYDEILQVTSAPHEQCVFCWQVSRLPFDVGSRRCRTRWTRLRWRPGCNRKKNVQVGPNPCIT